MNSSRHIEECSSQDSTMAFETDGGDSETSSYVLVPGNPNVLPEDNCLQEEPTEQHLQHAEIDEIETNEQHSLHAEGGEIETNEQHSLHAEGDEIEKNEQHSLHAEGDEIETKGIPSRGEDSDAEAVGAETFDFEKVQHPGDTEKVTRRINPVSTDLSVDATMHSEESKHNSNDDEKLPHERNHTGREASADNTMESKQPNQCDDYGNLARSTSPTPGEVSVDKQLESKKVPQCDMKGDNERIEEQLDKDGDDTPSTEKIETVLHHHSLYKQHSNEKKENYQETAVAISNKNCTDMDIENASESAKTPPTESNKLAQHKKTPELDSKQPPESDQKLPAEAKRAHSPSASSVATGIQGLSLDDFSAISARENDSLISPYPLDGKWEMTWKMHPQNTTIFEVRNHSFQMFDHPCDIIWFESPSGNCCANLQWPELVTSAENPVFQESNDILPGATSIEWSTSDPQYGDIIWRRLDSKAESNEKTDSTANKDGLERNKQRSGTEALYPLDGNWVLSWKSYYLDPSLVIVHKHKFEMFDYPCEIVFKDEDNFCPSFQWPVAVFSLDTPIFQKGKKSIPNDLISTDWPDTIEWTITDPQYGEATWTRLNPENSVVDYIAGRKRKAIDVAEEIESIKKRREEEEKLMKSSIPGKAWDLVKGAIELSSEVFDVDTIAEDDIIYLAERLLRAQKYFKENGIPWKVDIAYHHTQSINLWTIKTDGLLSRMEREERNIQSQYNGSAFGDGIYCSADPIRYANQRYGDTTILLARMKGVEGVHKYDDCNTVVNSGSFCVLKSCNQCIPLFKFQSKLLGSTSLRLPRAGEVRLFREKLAIFQKVIQGLLDQVLNENDVTLVDVAWATRYDIDDFLPTIASPSPPPLNLPPPLAPLRNVTVRYIQNCTSTSELQNILRGNMSQDLCIAAKKRLMTISPQSYTDYLGRNQTQIGPSVPQNLNITVQQNPTFAQQSKLSVQRYLRWEKRHLQRSKERSLRWEKRHLQRNLPCKSSNSPPILPTPFALGQNGKSCANTTQPEIISYNAPDSLAETDYKDFCKPCLTHKELAMGCPMCCNSLLHEGKIVQVASCGHIFHGKCLKKSMETNPYCPVCSLPISKTHFRGKMPSGHMKITKDSSHCHGYEEFPTFVIQYVITPGFQKNYHPNPGLPFHFGSHFLTYIPASPAGTQLLTRLKFTFSRGLSFSVGVDNWVTPEISIKRSRSAPSYPDPSFIAKCNNELDALHVPSALEISLQLTAQTGLQISPTLTSVMAQASDPNASTVAVARANAGNSNSGAGATTPCHNTSSFPVQSNIKPLPYKSVPFTGSVQASKPIATSSGSPKADLDTVPPPQGYASFTNDNLNFPVTWQSNNDMTDRRKVVISIFEILRTKAPENSAILPRLPNMARNLEENLYRNASTKDAYMDTSTLKFRLEQMGFGAFSKA